MIHIKRILIIRKRLPFILFCFSVHSSSLDHYEIRTHTHTRARTQTNTLFLTPLSLSLPVCLSVSSALSVLFRNTKFYTQYKNSPFKLLLLLFLFFSLNFIFFLKKCKQIPSLQSSECNANKPWRILRILLLIKY